MAEERSVFGQTVTVEKIKVDIHAIGEGYVVTVRVVLDNEDTLVAHTVARPEASFEDASGPMIEEAVKATSAWFDEHK